MEPLFFESSPPFVIRVYATYFQIRWKDSEETPEDNYRYENVNALWIKKGKEKEGWPLLEFILDYFTHGGLARKVREYDELIIEFKNGETETRYIHGLSNDEMNEAIEIIRNKINQKR